MNGLMKIPVVVPAGIRYLGEKGWFRLSNFPNQCIINKQNPGCGFTEYCLTGPENVILCSPRKLLLKNKYDQHKDDVYLVVNSMEKDLGVDIDLDKNSKTRINTITKNDIIGNNIDVDKNSEVYSRIYKEIDQYVGKRYCRPGASLKILVTYDSYHLVVDILRSLNIFSKFYTIVDEFQSILHDARFKSNTEMGFMNQLKKSIRTIFVSATPILDEYLDMLDEFKYLPYYELNWGKEDITRVIKPDLQVSTMKSISSKSSEIIESYLSGNFEGVTVLRNGRPTVIYSDEAVLYVNSVNHILGIIKKNNLTPDQVNILCADTEENKLKIKNKLGKGFSIGEIPLKGDKPKMFTFCTRTVYLGADFYSTCARTFIFSDSNSDSLAVDISEDLPQILGRQRLNENPWKNSAEFFYKTTADYKRMTSEDFNKKLNSKIEKTNKKLTAYMEATSFSNKETIAESYQTVAKLTSYKDDYVAVNVEIDFEPEIGKIQRLVPVENKLVKVNELRAFKIQQIDYKDRFTVFATINNKLTLDNNTSEINSIVINFMKSYELKTTIVDRLRMLCECELPEEIFNIIMAQIVDSDTVKSYYIALGPEKLKSFGYNLTYIKKELGIVTFSPEVLVNTIYSNFHVGEKYLLSNLKNTLSNLYYSISYKATPKAIDILNYFEVKEFKVTAEIDGVKKRVRGYELISSKELEFRAKLDLMKKGEL